MNPLFFYYLNAACESFFWTTIFDNILIAFLCDRQNINLEVLLSLSFTLPIKGNSSWIPLISFFLFFFWPHLCSWEILICQIHSLLFRWYRSEEPWRLFRGTWCPWTNLVGEVFSLKCWKRADSKSKKVNGGRGGFLFVLFFKILFYFWEYYRCPYFPPFAPPSISLPRAINLT